MTTPTYVVAKPLIPEIVDIDDGIKQLLGIENEVQKLFLDLRGTQHKLIVQRFRQGAIIHHMIEKAEGTTVEQVLQHIVERTGISRTILTESRRFYLHENWQRSEGRLVEYLATTGIRMTWGRIRGQMKNQYHKGTPEYFSRETEQIEQTLMAISERIDAFDEELEQSALGDNLLTGKGVVFKAREITADFLERAQQMKDSVAPIRDEAYLAYIRQLSCCVTGAAAPSEPHHIFTRGRGVKCSDYATIPLSTEMHHRLHEVGQKSFYATYNINPWECVAQCLAMYSFGTRLY